MPKVNPEPVRKNRMSCVCSREKDNDGFEDCECSLVNLRDTGKKYAVKKVKMRSLGEAENVFEEKPKDEEEEEDISEEDIFTGIFS